MNTVLDVNSLRKGYSFYYTPRTKEEADLVALTKDMLLRYFTEEEVQKFFCSNPTVREASLRIPEVQKVLLTKWWYTLLCYIEDSLAARHYLVSENNYLAWLSTVETKVIPFLMGKYRGQKA